MNSFNEENFPEENSKNKTFYAEQNNLWDTIVVGAGPAGAVSALLLAQEGKKVLLVDKAAFPRTKVCGSCLSSKTAALLKRAGLKDLLEENRAEKITDFKLCTARGAMSIPLPTGYALSRESLDFAIIKRGQAAGVTFAPSTQASVGPCSDNLRAVKISSAEKSKTIFARAVIVADGINGQALAALSGDEGQLFKPEISKSSRIGAGTIVPYAADGANLYQRGTIYMAVNNRGYAGVVKLENGDLDLACAFDPAFTRLCGSPQAAARAILTNSQLPYLDAFDQCHWHGTAPFTRQRRHVAGERLFVVGDAASYGEPFTGEGIGWAIYGALQVVPYVSAAIQNWDHCLMTAWQSEYSKNICARQQMSRRLGSLLRHEEFSQFLVGGILRYMPALAAPIVNRISR